MAWAVGPKDFLVFMFRRYWDRHFRLVAELSGFLSFVAEAINCSGLMTPAYALQDEAKRIMREHRWEDAIPILMKDLEVNPIDPWSLMYLGSCYYELRDYQTALVWFRQAEQLDPENPTPIGLQGDALHCLGHADEARRSYLRALEIAPDDELAIKNWKRFNEIEKRAEDVPPNT